MARYKGFTRMDLERALIEANDVFEDNLEMRGPHGSYSGPEALNKAETTWQLRLAVKNANREIVNVRRLDGTVTPTWIYPPGARYSEHTRKIKVRGVELEVPHRGIRGACWHAHGHFMRALFMLKPEGKIRTAMGTWHGRKAFMSNDMENPKGPKYPMVSTVMRTSCMCGLMETRRWAFRS